MPEEQAAEGRPLIEGEFTLDKDFQQFYARFTVSKRPMGTFALLSVPWVALKLTEPVWATRHPLVSSSVSLFILIEMLLLVETLGGYCAWLGAVRLQRRWLHLLDGEWHGGDPELGLSLGGGHADVKLVGYGPPAGRAPERPPQWLVNSSLASYREITPVDGRHERGDVTATVWGETYALLRLGGRSMLFDTAEGASRVPVARARITPAVPVPLAQMQEADKARLRCTLEKRGIPIREVRDENWLRRALRALRH